MKRRVRYVFLTILIFFGCLALVVLTGCDSKGSAEVQIRKDLAEGQIKVANIIRSGKATFRGHVDQKTPEGPIVVATCDVVVELIDNNGKKQTKTHTLEYKAIHCANYEIECDDPWVLQVPMDWYDFTGTFRGARKTGEQRKTGNLEIWEGPILAYFDGETYETYAAEDGYRVIALGFPSGRNLPPGPYEFTSAFAS